MDVKSWLAIFVSRILELETELTVLKSKMVYLQVRVCAEMPSPIQSIDVDHSTLPLPPTDRVDAGDWSSNGLPMPVRCIHQIRVPETESLPNQTDTIPAFISEVWSALHMTPFHRVCILIFFNKTASY